MKNKILIGPFEWDGKFQVDEYRVSYSGSSCELSYLIIIKKQDEADPHDPFAFAEIYFQRYRGDKFGMSMDVVNGWTDYDSGLIWALFHCLENYISSRVNLSGANAFKKSIKETVEQFAKSDEYNNWIVLS